MIQNNIQNMYNERNKRNEITNSTFKNLGTQFAGKKTMNKEVNQNGKIEKSMK